MTSESFDPQEYARQEILPLLSRLGEMTAQRREQADYFNTLAKSLRDAKDNSDLVQAFFTLSSANVMGFDYAPKVAQLLDTVLERAELLSASQTVPLAERH
jgi:hypothetical protein